MIRTCLGRISAPLFLRAANIPERCARVCQLAPALWRLGQPPGTASLRFTQPRLSGSWLSDLKWTEHRGSCFFQAVKRSGVANQRGFGRSAAGPRPLLLPAARGLCSRKSEEAPGGSTAADKEAEPGQGLFKFKELVRPYYLQTGGNKDLDGYIARTWPTQKSALGSALDPLADKILISVLYVSLTFAQLIPAPLTALVIFRDVGLIAAVFWVRYKTVPPPVRNAVKHEGSAAYCKYAHYHFFLCFILLSVQFNTAIQLCLVAASLAAPVFQYTDSILLQCLWYVTAVTTAASGYSYWHYGRKTVQLLNARSP
ncbi:PREDICTED: uncharacterized protein LOC107098656 [Cyprinodon variegatus]|uniref:uncharacterized protein LOC107098656 n=1 Tax=Cyprinodon variegatus TaxID=28743 RepID=UPI000742B0A3|nr:PREDICTED: uncharacterized protein LOC107098656 [Cyprinodon variegatus]